MSKKLDIPDETIEFVRRLSDATDMCLGDCLGGLASDMRRDGPKERSQRAAAVIEAHTRAAQVQILREMADEFNSFHNDGADPMVERTLRVLILRLRGKANDLEASNG